MQLSNPNADLFVPDGVALPDAAHLAARWKVTIKATLLNCASVRPRAFSTTRPLPLLGGKQQKFVSVRSTQVSAGEGCRLRR